MAAGQAATQLTTSTAAERWLVAVRRPSGLLVFLWNARSTYYTYVLWLAGIQPWPDAAAAAAGEGRTNKQYTCMAGSELKKLN